jgi:hypothetical protein
MIDAIGHVTRKGRSDFHLEHFIALFGHIKTSVYFPLVILTVEQIMTI